MGGDYILNGIKTSTMGSERAGPCNAISPRRLLCVALRTAGAGSPKP